MNKKNYITFWLNNTIHQTTIPNAQQLFIHLMHSECESYFCLPYKDKFHKDYWHQTFEDGVHYFREQEVSLSSLQENTDSYISINGFSGKILTSKNGSKYYSRQEVDCTHINGILIDLDMHNIKLNDIDTTCNKFLEWMKVEIELKHLLQPTSIIETKRGLALFFKYSNFEITIENIKKHKEMTKQLYRFYKKFIPFDSSIVEVDTSCSDLSRVCRIPYTFNKKANKYAEIYSLNTDAIYEPEKIYSFYNLQYVEKGNKKNNISSKNVTTSKRERTQSKKKTVCSDFNSIEAENILKLDRDISLKHNLQAVIVADKRLKLITKYVMINSTKFHEGTGRRDIIYAAYNIANTKYSHNQSVEYVIRLNELFIEPLTTNYFCNSIMNIDERILGNKPDFFSTDVLIEKLHISRNEAEALGFYNNSKKIEKRKQHINDNINRDKTIISMIIDNPEMKFKDIYKYIQKDYSLSYSQFKKILVKYGINKDTRNIININEIDFISNRSWKRKKITSTISHSDFNNFLKSIF